MITNTAPKHSILAVLAVWYRRSNASYRRDCHSSAVRRTPGFSRLCLLCFIYAAMSSRCGSKADRALRGPLQLRRMMPPSRVYSKVPRCAMSTETSQTLAVRRILLARSEGSCGFSCSRAIFSQKLPLEVPRLALAVPVERGGVTELHDLRTRVSAQRADASPDVFGTGR